VECEYETVPKLLIDTIFNDLERPITQISRSRHYLIPEPVPNIYSYNEILIGTYTRPTQGCHFE